MNRRRVVGVIVFVLLTSACRLATVRTPEMGGRTPDEESIRHAHRLLEAALQASGGRERWDNYRFAEMTFEDEWRGWIGRLFRPWPGNPTRLRMRYELGMRAAECTIVSEKQNGLRIGREMQGNWVEQPGRERRYGDHEKYRFILSAYQYFFELPRRALEAPIVAYAGRRERDGREFDRVFATWGKLEKHEEHDQYLFWIARDTRRIEIVEYTIRDKLASAVGVNVMSDFRTIDGLTVPHHYTIFRHLDDDAFVHRAQLSDLHFSHGP